MSPRYTGARYPALHPPPPRKKTGEQVHTLGSTKQHTHSALIPPPPKKNLSTLPPRTVPRIPIFTFCSSVLTTLSAHPRRSSDRRVVMASQVDVAPAGGAAAARRVWHPADGETPLQMTHAWAVKEQGRDTSQDQPWDVDWWLAGAEVYVYALSGLWLVPKVLVFVPLLFLLQWPAVFVIWVYGMSFQWSTDAVDRTTGGFRVMVALFWLLFLPAALVAFLSYLLDCVVYYLFGVLYCTLTFGWCRLARSFRALAPYRGGPGLLWHFTDVIVALTGQCIRNGLLESTWKMSVMWTVLPWLKYWINANPFVYDLSERFVQQITTSMQDMALEEVPLQLSLAACLPATPNNGVVHMSRAKH